MDGSGPLTVREKKRHIWAEDSSGSVVVDGMSGRAVWPDRFVGTGPGGSWKIAAEAANGTDTYLPLLDPGMREVARLHYVKRRGWQLHLASGELVQAEGGGSGLFNPIRCTIGDFSSAVAPRLAPQRHFTLTLTEAAHNHPLRDALTVATVWISEQTIASIISENAGGD
jgi:hypothetical protein